MDEWKDVQILFGDRTSEEICRDRTEYSMRWYINKAIWNKRIYYLFSFIGMLCPLLNAVIVVCWDCKMITVLLASVSSLSVSLLSLTNAKSKWENYRSAAEYIKCEYTLFQARVGVYDSAERTSAYLQSIENYMQKTHINWRKIIDNSKEEKTGRG